ncbi:Ig-like domain-containing protein [uncultured Salegentibacter sp.]|uniref:tandem-95 repeat protein n=1 Tax=uncultured Salegentibacter sp. TaxID=259320 RepID=UPI0025967A92|nr:Ig-like domain-containing protein [uncultured Salegentibacter sp.]
MKHDYFTLPGFSFRLRPCSLSIALFLLIFLLNFTLGFGQEVTISSNGDEGPVFTQQQTIPLSFEFDERINDFALNDVLVGNSTLSNFFVEWPDFQYTDDPKRLKSFDIDIVSPPEDIDFSPSSNAIISVDIDAAGFIYALTLDEGVFKYNPNGSLTSGNPLIGADKFTEPRDLAVDSSGNLFIADSGADQVLKFDNNGGNMEVLNSSTSLSSPSGLAISSDQRIYVADTENNRVVFFNNNGTKAGEIDNGSGTEGLLKPIRLAVDKTFNVYVTDAGNNRIQIYDSNANHTGSLAGNSVLLNNPGSLVVDDYGFLYVADFDGVNLNSFLNFEDIEPLEAINLISANHEIKVFRIKDLNDTPAIIDSGALNVPIDLAIKSCGYLAVNNGDAKFEGFTKIKFIFDLKTYEVLPTAFAVDLKIEQECLAAEVSVGANVGKKADCSETPVNGDVFTATWDQTKPELITNCEGKDQIVQSGFIISDYIDNGEVSFNDNCGVENLKYSQTPDVGETITQNTTVRITATDQAGNVSEVCSFELVLETVNTAPTAVDDVYAVDQDAILNESAPGVLENDTDAEADNLTTSIVSTVSNGTLTLNSDGSFIYEPNTGYFGPDSFTYIANDGIDDSEVATVSITVNQVSPTNTAPKAVDDVYAVDQDAILNESAPGVLENDTDAEADNLTVSIVSTVSNGTLTLNSDGSFIYEPNTGYFGSDNFTYVANDGIEDSGVATVSITVNQVSPTNTAPTAVDDVYVVDQDAILNESAPGVLENDTDAEADNLTASIVSTVSNGTLTFNPDGSFIYEPNTDYFGSDSFTYIANDGNDDSEVATVTITVNSTNPNAPEIDCVNHELFLDENGQAVLNPGDLLVGEPGNLLITADKVNFDCTNLGANDVILTATDPETGLSSTCSTSILIIDEIFPVASCKTGYKVYLDNSGNATLAPEDLNNNSTDNCGIDSMALSQINFTRADLGEVPITLTVRDEAGNMDSCETTVEVVEEASGNFECRESIVVYLDENGEAGLSLDELYTGDASGITLEASQLRFNCNDVGEVPVQLDYSGAQTGSCSISVEVRDEVAPEIITDVVELSLDAEGFAYLEENDVLVQDNCSREFVYRFGKSVFSCEDVGSNTINVEVEDINGNIATKNIEVRVNGEACETPDDLKFLFIYPNPNSGIFTIVTPDGMTVERVRVFDSRGRYILQQNYNVSGRFYRMSIEAVAESVYTLQIFTNKGIVVKRVIVSR